MYDRTTPFEGKPYHIQASFIQLKLMDYSYELLFVCTVTLQCAYLHHAIDECLPSIRTSFKNSLLQLLEVSINKGEVREQETLKMLNIWFTELTQAQYHTNAILLLAFGWL